jgi:hypothetical protein
MSPKATSAKRCFSFFEIVKPELAMEPVPVLPVLPSFFDLTLAALPQICALRRRLGLVDTFGVVLLNRADIALINERNLLLRAVLISGIAEASPPLLLLSSILQRLVRLPKG